MPEMPRDATYNDLPIEARRILARARKSTDRELLALGAAWRRVFATNGNNPPTAQLDRMAVAWRSLNRGTLTGDWYRPIRAYAKRCGDRVYRTDLGPRSYHEPKRPDQCVQIAIEGAAIVACLAPYYQPGDALTTELQRFSAPWRRVMGDEPLLSLLSAPRKEGAA